MKKTNFKSVMTKICLLFAVCLLVSFNPVKAEAATVSGQDIVTEAKRHLGKPYVYGGNGPNVFDCSGFTKYVYGQFGITLPRVASDQAKAGTAVSRENLQPGDLVFWGSPAYHVGIYIGSGQYIHAPQDNDVVKISTLGTYTSARRILTTNSSINGWVNSNGWYYYLNGVKQTGWVYVDGNWYYLDSNGLMKTGWVDPNADWYYLKGDGSMQIGWYLEGSNWFFLNDSSDRGPIGKMLKEWAYINGAWYYFNGSGIMQTGWLNHNGTWYYLNSNGAMRTEPLTENGKTYYFASNGACTNP